MADERQNLEATDGSVILLVDDNPTNLGILVTRSSDTFGGPRHSCGGGKTN
jgi:hypothetical protein